MPAKHEEQKAIGEFLCGIDNLITLHQREHLRLYPKINLCVKGCFHRREEEIE